MSGTATWVDRAGTYWRAERLGDRWHLSYWSITERCWRHVSTFFSREAAIEAAR
jgi:TfoX/Sxy family transcriptional regulator of competence genes